MPSEIAGAAEFAQVLRSAAASALGDTTAVIEVGAKKIERQLRADMRKHRYFRGVVPNITHDVTVTAGLVSAEIGPETGPGRPGALANIAYFGGSNGGGGTVTDPMRALKLEAAIVQQKLAENIWKSLQ